MPHYLQVVYDATLVPSGLSSNTWVQIPMGISALFAEGLASECSWFASRRFVYIYMATQKAGFCTYSRPVENELQPSLPAGALPGLLLHTYHSGCYVCLVCLSVERGQARLFFEKACVRPKTNQHPTARCRTMCFRRFRCFGFFAKMIVPTQ